MNSTPPVAPATPDYVPNMRRLRAMLAVADTGGVMRAAESLHLSQPTVSRALRNLESELGLELFERNRSGMLCTAAGDIVASRFRRALEHLTNAEREIQRCCNETINRLSQHLSYRQMRVLVTLAELHTEQLAARRLVLSTAAVSNHLRELEKQLGITLFHRNRQGMSTTECGAILARHLHLALQELSRVSDDLSEWLGKSAGRLLIGAMPFAGSLLVPKALSALLKEFPGASLSVLDGTYDALIKALHKGDIDILVGVLGGGESPAGIEEVGLHDDQLSVVARKDHPLMRRAPRQLRDLLDATWIAPRLGSPARRSFDQTFRNAGLPQPGIAIETGNLVSIHRLLLDSDLMTLMSPALSKIWGEQLAVLPIELQGGDHRISYYRHETRTASQLLDRFCELLALTARDLEPEKDTGEPANRSL